MAIVITSNPGTYYSAHGDLIFTVYEATKANDPVTYPDYRYVLDVYVGATLITRLKAYPHPDTKIGVFNVGNVIRDYLAATFNPSTGLRPQQLGSGEFFIEATMKFGEEYDFDLYTNLTVESARVYFNHYNGRLLGSNTTLSSYLDKALTARPYVTPVNDDDSYCFVPFLPTDTDNVTLSIKSYTQGGTLLDTISQAFTPAAANTLQLFNIAPAVLNAITANFINDGVHYYTVEFQTPNISDDSIYRFNLTCEAQHTVYTLHFLNRFGGFESRNFTKVSRKTIDIERKDFTKLPYTVDASGNVSYKNANNVYNETRSTYAAIYSEKMTLNSNFLSDDEYAWMADLILSPMVFIEMDGYFVGTTITANNYEFRKRINDKLTALTIDIEFGDQFNSQFR